MISVRKRTMRIAGQIGLDVLCTQIHFEDYFDVFWRY